MNYNSPITHPFAKDSTRIHCYFIQYEERMVGDFRKLTCRCTDRQGIFWNVLLDNIWEGHLELGHVENLKWEREQQK